MALEVLRLVVDASLYPTGKLACFWRCCRDFFGRQDCKMYVVAYFGFIDQRRFVPVNLHVLHDLLL